jgi:hypothetical protein
MNEKDVSARKKQDEGKQQADLAELQLIRAEGAVFWEEVKSKLPERLAQFNISLGGIVVISMIEVSPNELRLENKKSQVMAATLTFEPVQSTIYVYALHASHEFNVKIFAGQPSLYSRELGHKTPEDLTKYILESLAKFIR